jgi:DNA-binding response OmpR family regulator
MGAKARILCVDDDRPTITIVSSVLRKEGYEVETALSGADGLKKAREMKPDLVILDVMMPDMDGFQVCRFLKDDPDTAHIEVLMLTSKGGVNRPARDVHCFRTKLDDRMEGFDVGALEFLTKPIKAKTLVERVNAVLWALGFSV